MTMKYRTDLAVEALEMLQGEPSSSLNGIKTEEKKLDGFDYTLVEVLNETGEKSLGKPKGRYITFDLGSLIRREEDAFERAVSSLSKIISETLKIKDNELVLIAGLGNRAITPDALGPKTADNLVITRHLVSSVPEYFSSYRPVAAVSPGVLGITGIETGEIIKGVKEKVAPAALIAIDALASHRLSRLVKTIQISDVGIIPGSGIGNARFPLTPDNLGIPVIAIGVPTVVDGKNLALEIEEQAKNVSCNALDDLKQSVIVTTTDIDKQIADISKIIGYSISQALNPSLTIEDIDLFLS